jgi:hypothetical protein
MAALAPWLHSQVRGTAVGVRMPGPRTFTAGSFPNNSISGRAAFNRRPFHRGVFLGDPFFYSDYVPSEPQGPPEIVLVEPRTSPPEQPSEIHSAAPLLIEWQGDHYARVSEEDRSAPTTGVSQAFQPSPPSHVTADPPPATLVFRDGRQEQVMSYTIVDGTLYASSDYWTNGSWTRPIRLSQLDIPATLRSNHDRGVKFLLPSGPNEVVARP